MSSAGPSVLAVVTARGGSKGLPGKNIRPLGGRALIAWTVEAGLKARAVDRLILSTDDPEIAEAGRAAGAEVPFLRPAHLASDAASSADVLHHALEACPGHDVVLLLQPTSPLRGAGDIDAAFAAMTAAGAESCTSVSAVEKSPWLMYRLDGAGRLDRLLPPPPGGLRRQDLPAVYALNGALYFRTVESFRRTGQLVDETTLAHVMSAEASVDIDTIEDFERAEAILARRGHDPQTGAGA